MQPTLNFVFIGLATCLFLSLLPRKVLNLFPQSWQSKCQESRNWTGAGWVGSIAGVATYVFLPPTLAQAWWMILAGVASSIFVGHYAERAFGSHDDPRIVIDEWIGAWIACWGLAPQMGIPILIALLCFRFFDVFKGPWGRKIQMLPGGFGIVLDDVAAGILANISTLILLYLWVRLF